MRYIDGMGGRFLTVLPRTRKEDALFREHVADHELPWETVRHRPNPRRQERLPDVWKDVEWPIPAGDGFRRVWVWSSLMAEEDREAREAKIATIQKMACGFRNKDHFRTAARFRCGGLQLHPETDPIPG